MNKEYKFRAWDFEYKRMVYFQPLTAVIDVANSIKLHAYGNLHSSGNISPLMQFTGREDRDGKEIWERDFIWRKYIGIILLVRWNPNKSAFELCDPKKPDDFNANFVWFNEDYEKIGNIFEHPHLLEK